VVALEGRGNDGIKRVTTRVTPTDLKWKYDEALHWRYSSARDYEGVRGLLEIERFW